MNIDKKDLIILKELQTNCRQSLKEIAQKTGLSITTIYDRMQKLEKEKVIKGYKAIIDSEKVNKGVTVFILISARYRYQDTDEPIDQHQIARQISFLPGVMEVYIIAGEWDILVKARGRDVKEIGDFVISNLRNIRGIDKSMTIHAWFQEKESVDIL